MVVYAVDDPAQIPYYDILNEVPHLTVGVCPLRASDFDGNFVKFYTEKIQALGPVDRLIIDDFTEARPLHEIDQLIDNLIAICNISRNNIVYIDGGEYASRTVISYPTFYSLTEFRLLKYEKDTVIPWEHRDKLLLSLCRRPTWFRIAFTEELIKRDLLDYSVVSCGSSLESNSDGWINLFVSPELQHHFPFLVDGIISRQQEAYLNERSFSRAFINVVSETSHNPVPNSTFNLDEHIAADPNNRTPDGLHHWTRVFVTEKTTKAVAMRQIPIFNTVQHHVRLMRAMGMDLFDDIIDHSYDEIEDPTERIQAVAAQVEQLYKRGHEYFRNILRIQERLEHNVACINHQYKIRLQDAEHKIREFLNHGHVTL
jgi:hypothetical protein